MPANLADVALSDRMPDVHPVHGSSAVEYNLKIIFAFLDSRSPLMTKPGPSLCTFIWSLVLPLTSYMPLIMRRLKTIDLSHAYGSAQTAGLASAKKLPGGSARTPTGRDAAASPNAGMRNYGATGRRERPRRFGAGGSSTGAGLRPSPSCFAIAERCAE